MTFNSIILLVFFVVILAVISHESQDSAAESGAPGSGYFKEVNGCEWCPVMAWRLVTKY